MNRIIKTQRTPNPRERVNNSCKFFNTYLLKTAVILVVSGFLFFGSTAQANATTYTGYSSASDGYVFTSGPAGEGYLNYRNAATGIIQDTLTIIQIGQFLNDDPDYGVSRGFVFFDTSSIPSDATITSATLSLYGNFDSSETDFSITVQNGQPTYPHDPLVSGDYLQSQYSSDGGSLSTVGGFSTSGYSDITLNSTGLGWIQKAGATKLTLRGSTDISATTPTNRHYVRVWSNEKGAGYQPKLVVNYTLPNTAPTGTFNSATQATDGTGNVAVSITVNDADTNNCTAKIQYSTSATCASGLTKATLTGTLTASVTPAPDLTQANAYQIGTTTPILTTSANTVTFVWDSKTDLPDATGDTNYYLCLTANDGTVDQTSIGASSAIAVDNTNPTVSAGEDQSKTAVFTQIATASDAGGINASSYQWAKVSGPGTVTFGTATALSTTILADTAGTYVISFTAQDAAGNSSTDNFSVTFTFATTEFIPGQAIARDGHIGNTFNVFSVN